MVIMELKTADAVNQQQDDESGNVCTECGSELEGGICQECDADGELNKEEVSPTETAGEEDEYWIK